MSSDHLRVGTVVGIVLCGLCVTLVLTGASWAQPKSNRIVLGALIVVWYWTTTIWATGTKQIVKDLGDKEIYPSTSFWLTLIPQLVASACVALIAAAKGVKLWDGTLRPATGSGLPRVAWFAAGAGFFFGQLFTVVSLASAAPSICFVIKAIEPLTTALLAIPVLKQSVSWRLLAAIMVSCAGIVMTAVGSHGGAAHGVKADQLRLAIVCGFLCNCGFSSRACVVKKAMAHGTSSGTETFGKISVAACVCGITMLFLWLIILIAKPHSFTYQYAFANLLETWRSHTGTWLAMSFCYFLYQCSSLLILDCFFVESHALLVAMKHIFVVIIASLLTHSGLSVLAIVGVVIAATGVCWYAVSPPPVESGETKPILPRADEKKTAPTIFGDLPPVLIGIVAGMVILGNLSPVLTVFW
jgi:drug/metabolite transporter (DMT)-like permease